MSEPEIEHCNHCREPMPHGTQFCPHCGANQHPDKIWTSTPFWLLVIVGVPAFAAGICSVVAIIAAIPDTIHGSDPGMAQSIVLLIALFGLIAFVVFGAILKEFIKSRRK